MKAHILGFSDTEIGCDFEAWDKEKKCIAPCARPSVAKIARRHYCIEHIVDALAFSGKLDMEDVPIGKNKYGKEILYKEDFLKICKKREEENSRLREEKGQMLLSSEKHHGF